MVINLIQAKAARNSPDQVDANIGKVNELNQLRQKIDCLTLEKNSFKCKNDELMRDLESATKNLESLQSINKEFKELNNKSTQTAQLNKLISQLVQTDFNMKLVAKTNSSHAQTDPLKTTPQQQLPPPPPPPPPPQPQPVVSVPSSTANEIVTDILLKHEDEDVELLRKEKIELEIKVNELTNEKYLNIKLTNELSELTKEMEKERKEYENKTNKLINDFNISKQVSDTIIQQQKKLLHYLQTKMSGKGLVETEVESAPVAIGGSGSGSGGHNIKNIFKVR